MAAFLKQAVASRGFAMAFSATAFLCALMLACPSPAFADIAGDINAWLCGILRDTCNWIFSSQADMLKSIGAGGVLSSGFTQMLGHAGTVTMYDLVRGVWQHAILPMGCGMLSFVFTVQLIKVSQKMDGNASMPGLKEVVFMLVFFAVFLFLIQNSFDLMAAIYEVVKLAIDRVVGLFGAGMPLDLSAVSITTTDDDVAALIAMLVVALVSWLVVIVAYVVALVVSWARHTDLRHGGLQPHPPRAHLPRRDAADGRRVLEELPRGVPGGGHHPGAARVVSHRARRAQRRERGRARGGLHRGRALLRAAVPRHVRAAHPVAREERFVGPRHPGRLMPHARPCPRPLKGRALNTRTAASTPKAEPKTKMQRRQEMAEETQAPKEKKNVYISLHKAFVHENIKYTDKKTGQEKTFNVVRLPADTVIDGKDVGGYEFSPLYVNPSKFRGEDWRDIPLLADREVRLQKSVLDAEGKPVLGEDGKRQKETLTVKPQEIKTALAEARKRYAEEHAKDDRGLAERAEEAKEASSDLEKGDASRPLDREGR